MRRTMILAGALLAGCQAAPAAQPRPAAVTPVARLDLDTGGEIAMARIAGQDRNLRIAMSCGLRPYEWGERARELIGLAMARSIAVSDGDRERLRLIGAAMRTQAHILAGREMEAYGMEACRAFSARFGLDALTESLRATDPAFPR